MTVLQQLLNLGLMDIGSDDSRYSKMEIACDELMKKLLSEPTLIVPATLIAINCDVTEEESLFEIVENFVIEQSMSLT